LLLEQLSFARLSLVVDTTICVCFRIIAPLLATVHCLPIYPRYDASIWIIAHPVLITWIVCHCFHTVAAPSGSLRLGALFTLGNSNRISFAEGTLFLLGPLVSATRSKVPCQIVIDPNTATYLPYPVFVSIRLPHPQGACDRGIDTSCVRVVLCAHVVHLDLVVGRVNPTTPVRTTSTNCGSWSTSEPDSAQSSHLSQPR